MISTSSAAPRRRVLTMLLALALPVAVLLVLPPAGAATKDARPEIVQCFTDFPPAGCTDITPEGLHTIDVEISANGAQLYVLAIDGTVTIVDRASNGLLTPRSGVGSCFNSSGADDCTVNEGLAATDAEDLTLSPDGTSVYVATRNAVASFVRNPSTGDLTPSTCYAPSNPSCTTVPQLGTTIGAVIVSPGSLNTYVRSDGRLLAFDRATATGLLTLKALAAGCYTEAVTASCTKVVGLVGSAVELATSPDGTHLYVPNENGIAVFTRLPGGTLQQAAGTAGGCITSTGASSGANECQSAGPAGAAMQTAHAATVSPSGKHVFVSGNDGSLAFARNASTGLLTMTHCLSRQAVAGCDDRDGVAGYGVEVSPDGTRAIIGAGDVGGFGVFDFDETTGRFTQLPGLDGCYSGSGASGCTPIPGGFGGKSAWAPDGLNAYVVPSRNLLNVLMDHPPVCQSISVTVPQNTATSIPLACSDANGDPLTIEISGAPASGTVGAVDQAGHSVIYTPAAGFSGGTSFTFTATGGDRTSAPATVTITVPAPATPPPPPAPDTSVTLTIKGGKVALNVKGKAKVTLTCPATETHGPCSGKLTMRTRGKVTVNGKATRVVLGSATYSLKAGATKKVAVKLSAENQKLVEKNADARKLLLKAKVQDTVGNKATVKQKAKLTLP